MGLDYGLDEGLVIDYGEGGNKTAYGGGRQQNCRGGGRKRGGGQKGFIHAEGGGQKGFIHAEGGGVKRFWVVLTQELEVLAILNGGATSFHLLKGGMKFYHVLKFQTRDFSLL